MKTDVPFPGIENKYTDMDDIRMRIVEYHRDMEPHWCEKGHYGIVLEGTWDIEFPSGIIRYEKGDGLFLPPGAEHRHKATVITEYVKVFFLELLD